MIIKKFATHMIFQKEPSRLTYKGTVDSPHKIKIDCDISQSSDKTWELQVHFILFCPEETAHKFFETKKVFALAAGEAKFIGCWHDVFEKDGVTENFSPGIPLEMMNAYADQTLISLTAFENAITLHSDYLEGSDEPEPDK